MEDYLTHEITDSENRIVESLCKVAEDVEMKIFKEEGIDISDNELAELVKQETNDVKKSEPAASTNEILKSNSGNHSIEDVEDALIRLVNHILCVIQEDVDTSKVSLKQGIQNSLDDFLMKDK